MKTKILMWLIGVVLAGCIQLPLVRAAGGVELSCDNPVQQVPKEGVVFYEITVKNTGSVRDVFGFNKGYFEQILHEERWGSIITSVDKMTLDPGKSRVLYVLVHPGPQTAVGEKRVFTLECRSETTGATASINFTVIVGAEKRPRISPFYNEQNFPSHTENVPEQPLLWKKSIGSIIMSGAASPDFEYIAVGTLDQHSYLPEYRGEGKICFFKRDGTLLWEKKIGPVWSIAISDNGAYIAVGAENYFYLFARSGELLWKKFAGEGYAVKAVAISPDGSRIVTDTGEKITIFDREGTVKGWHETDGPIRTISMTPDASRIVAGGHDATVYFLNGDGKLLWDYQIRGLVFSSAMTADASYIAIGSWDFCTYYFNRKGELLWRTNPGREKIRFVAVSSDGERVAAGDQGLLVYYYDKDGKLLWAFEPEHGVRTGGMTPDGKYIVAGTGGVGGVYLLNENGSLLWRYRTPAEVDQRWFTAISPDGKYIATGGWDMDVCFLQGLGVEAPPGEGLPAEEGMPPEEGINIVLIGSIGVIAAALFAAIMLKRGARKVGI